MVTNSVEIKMRGGGSRRRQRCKRGRGAAGPRKFEDFALGKRSKDASIMCHFNQKNTTNSMEWYTHISNMIRY